MARPLPVRRRTPSELRDATTFALHEARTLQPSNFAGLILDTTNLTATDPADTLFQLLSP